MTGPFSRVVVPIAFEAADKHEIAADRTVELSQGEWAVVGLPTIAALKLAAKLAAGGEVRLVHVTPDYRSVAVYGSQEGLWLNDNNIRELDETAKRQSLHVVTTFAQRYCEGVTLEYDIAPGKPLDVILEVAKQHPPDAIVLAASGHGRVRRAVLGSTADKIIRKAFCPVVVVPAEPD